MKTNFQLLATFALATGVNYSAFCQNWETGGNNVTPGEYLGSQNNQPLLFRTNNIQRLYLNENRTTTNPAPGFPSPVTTNGFLGINTDNPVAPLHIKGGSFVPGGGTIGGYRNWMNRGMLISDNTDNLYIGLKASDVSEGNDAVINWGDNIDATGGPDNLRFIFTSHSIYGLPSSSMDGLEIMRMIDNGNIGMGPMFTNTNRPNSLLHMNREGNLATYLQISNTNGTGQTATDGLR